jgi:hypothetical protein
MYLILYTLAIQFDSVPPTWYAMDCFPSSFTIAQRKNVLISFGGSVVLVDIDEPFFILVKARIADYKDYICTFELNGCDLGFTLHVFCGSGEFLCGEPNTDGARLRSICVTLSTNPWEERPYRQSLLAVHFYDVDLTTSQSYSFRPFKNNISLSTFQANYILSFCNPKLGVLLGSASISFCQDPNLS